MSDFVVAFICITVGALCSVAGFLMGFNSKMTPRDESQPAPAPPARNPPPPTWPQDKIAELEHEVQTLRRVQREEVVVTGLTEAYAFHVYRRNGRFIGNSGQAPTDTLCYTLDKDTAAQLTTGTDYRAELRLVWQLPDGRLARHTGERTTLHLIKPELVK